ncbi:hypothetical protein JTE90_029418 [Oedothorax gibbosus]|uniref:SWIM-type domain-containing protein n=1 Tax=Oedothorax gibbosus TaxID=931172 RepID=A0AAV6TYV7_9ARAC|nr:hypothetical protein JTE90_029418 [Oedothorax gibbosus]
MMVGDFFKSSPDFCSAEFRNVKTSASSRQSYGDEAIGYVQLKKESGLCTVKCRICPEHKVTTKSYSVTMVVNEMEGLVKKIECHDCTASEGCCKHAIAFLMWVHRRSEEPSCTSVECYWKKSKLSKVGRSLKITTAKELSKSRPTLKPNSLQTSVLEKFLEEGNKRKLECQILKHQPSYDHQSYSLHQLTIQLKGCKDAEEFLCRTSAMYDVKKIRQMELETRNQSENPEFEKTNTVTITEVQYNDIYVRDVLQKIEEFWRKYIFPLLVRNTAF